jgi:tetratricopeptide (TPR) repeat protein
MPRSRPVHSSTSGTGQSAHPALDVVADGIETAVELRNRALNQAQAGRSAEAIKLLRQALSSLPVTAGRPDAIMVRIRVLATLAFAEAEIGSVKDGLMHLGTASDLVSAVPDGQWRAALRGLVDHQHGAILLRSRSTAAALELFNRAMPMLEQAEGTPAGNPELFAVALMNRGVAHIKQGRPGPAEQDMRRCLALAAEHDVPMVMAKALGNLGEIAQLVGDIPRALRHYADVERSFRAIAPALVPRTQIDQARALLAAGVPDEAARHLDEALPVLREHRNSQDLAEAELARAAAALLQGELDQARTYAAAAHRRLVKRGSGPWAEVAALTKMQTDIAAALNGSSSSASARKAARLAERLAEMGLTDEAAKATMLAMRLALRRGSIEEAEALLGQVPSPRKIAPIDHKMLLRLCRAELAVAKGDYKGALMQARVGMDQLNQARDRMGGLDLVSGTAVHGWQLGDLAVGLVLDGARTAADARRLLAWQERTRAQVYRYEPLPAIDNPELAARVAELRTVLRTVQRARLDRRPVAGLDRRSVTLQREVSKLGWHTGNWGQPRPVCTPEEVIDQLGERALVSFAGPGENLAAVVVSGGRTRLVRLGFRDEALEAARQLHADLNALAPDDLVEPLLIAVLNSAQRRITRLDELLLRPMADLLGDRELVVVPFGGLYSVPWGSLPTLRGRPVSVAPSATAWVNAAAPAPAGAGADVVLVSGPGLPHSVSELASLRAIYPDAVVLDGDQATTDAVLKAMDGARLVHLAAHGMHEPANALFSRLELVDGGLLAHELARLRQPPEHVVLAACELALSHIRPGDEALGFADALLASGSRTVIAALSRVGDRTTAETMTDYHRRLANNHDAAVTLAETMTDYHRRLASGTTPAVALAEATAADPLRRPFICLGAG